MKILRRFGLVRAIVVAWVLATNSHSNAAIFHIDAMSFSLTESSGSEGWAQLWESPVRFAWENERFRIDDLSSPENYDFFVVPRMRDRLLLFEYSQSIGPATDEPSFGSGGTLAWPSQQDGFFYDREGYVGVRMSQLDDWFYAWIRVSHDATAGTLTVHDWAWNTIPNEPILAGQVPEPATVAFFMASIALAVAVVRRRRRTAFR